MNPAIESYDPAWSLHFEHIRESLSAQLHYIEEYVLEHIGSTSVPSLYARPIVDILLAVPSAGLEKVVLAFTSSKGYEQLQEEQATPDTVTLTNGGNYQHAHNLYVCESDSLAARVHIVVRDTLRKDKQLRDEYVATKTRALKTAEDADYKDEGKRPAYAQAKNEAIQEIIIASEQFTSADLATIFSSNCAARWTPTRTPRTLIREFELSDVDAMFALEGNEENARYQDWHPWTHFQARQNVLRGIRRSYEDARTVVELAVEFEGDFVGRIGGRITGQSASGDKQKTMGTEENEGVEQAAKHIDLWYSFLPSCQGIGLASEAMKAFVAQLVEKEKVGCESIELEIECDPRNIGSWKLAERLGFSKHSLTEKAWESKGEWVDSLVYRKMV
ncbi:hypothetical protein E8E11_006372 [Didymella keratinophila]|nr:hypothetical protein E8E11_006372 [Didymella keratinophila]